MSRAGGSDTVPRAMIHRRILDVAESNPEASIPAIADDVSGAAPSLVERVLDEYGDPAAETGQGTDASNDEADVEPEVTHTDELATGDQADGDSDPPKNAEDTTMATQNESTQAATGTDDADEELTLSEKQRRTLRAVHANPDGSQGDIADELGVTRATVSRRLNAIPEFEWSEREAFAESVFGERAPTDDRTGGDEPDSSVPETAVSTGEGETDVGEGESDTTESTVAETGGGEPTDTDGVSGAAASEGTHEDGVPDLADIDRRLSALEADDGGSDAPTLPPELAHKVVHACMESDSISEDEELELLKRLLGE